MENRVSSRKLAAMLVEVAMREWRKMEKLDLSRLNELADAAVEEAKARDASVILTRKKRSLRRRCGWAPSSFLKELINSKNKVSKEKEEEEIKSHKKRSRPIKNVSKEEKEEIKSHKKSKPLTKKTKPSEWLEKVMAREENAYEPKPIIARKLHMSDLVRGQGRLSMPLKQVVTSDFLNETEEKILKTHEKGVRVFLVDPSLNKHEVDLRMWTFGSGLHYVLVGGWNDVVDKNIFKQENNKFKIGNIFDVWSFRFGEQGQLCFALNSVL